ncbi:hypothetical protein KY335_05850 [Candidatus Woesearchaeota archaeon]|nr:hypothetical protein [Candidatus Woesearchaeota archaeon]
MADKKIQDTIQKYADQGYSISQIKRLLLKKYPDRQVKEAIHESYKSSSHISILSLPLMLMLIGIPIILFSILKLTALPEMTNTVFFSLLVVYPAVISAFLGYHCAKYHIPERQSLKYELLLGFITGILVFILFINYAPQEILNVPIYFAVALIVSLFIAVVFTLMFRLFFHERILPLHEHQPMMNYRNPFDILKFLRLGGDIYMIMFIVFLLFLGYLGGEVYTSLIFIVGFLIFNYLIDFSYRFQNELLVILLFVILFIFAGYLSFWLLLLVSLAFLKSMVYFYKTGKNHNFFALFNCWTILLTFAAVFLFAVLLFVNYVILPFVGHMSVMFLIIIYFVVLMITFPILIRIGIVFIGRVTGKINFYAAFYPLALIFKPRNHLTRDSIRYGIFLGFWIMLIVLLVVGITGTVFTSSIYERNSDRKASIISSIPPLNFEQDLYSFSWIHAIPEGTVLPSTFLSLQTQYESQLQSYKNYHIPRDTGFGAFFRFLSGKVFEDFLQNLNRIIRLNIITQTVRENTVVAVDEFASINANRIAGIHFIDKTVNLQEHVSKMRFSSDRLYEILSPTFGLEKQEIFVPYQRSPFYPETILGDVIDDFLKHSNLALMMVGQSNMHIELQKEFSNERWIETFRKPAETALSLEDESLRLKLLLHHLGKEHLEGCEADDIECYSQLTLFMSDVSVCMFAETPKACEQVFLDAFPQYFRCPDNTIVNKELERCR